MRSKSGCDDCSRRTLLKGLGLAALSPLVLGGCQPGSNLPTGTATTSGSVLSLDLTAAANLPLTMAGGALLVDTPQDTIVVIRDSDTKVVALSAVCTHSGCIIDFDANAKQITCPCHNSVFAETGSVLQGPARTPLAVYVAALNGSTIMIAV